MHKGFSFIDALQPCFIWFNTFETYNQRVYELEENDLLSKEKAIQRILEWDYNDGKKIPIGVFYKIEKPTFDKEASKGLSKIADFGPQIKEILAKKS